MKHFKLIGPETTREFDIEEDEMISLTVYKIEHEFALSKPMQNEVIYPTEKS